MLTQLRSRSGSATSTVLAASDVSVAFGALRALDGVSLALARGEVVGLIGPNGAGKTTFLNVLSGFQALTTGRVELGGEDVTRVPADERARRGVVRTFQAVRLFPALTVRENVEVAALGVGVPSREARAAGADLLARLGLDRWADRVAGTLPYGAERRLGIARCLATRPEFVLLDEPVAGMDVAETDELVDVLRDAVARHGCGVLVVEHDMRFVMSLCARVHVLDHGRPLAAGTPEQVQADPAVRTAYLGAGTPGQEG